MRVRAEGEYPLISRKKKKRKKKRGRRREEIEEAKCETAEEYGSGRTREGGRGTNFCDILGRMGEDDEGEGEGGSEEDCRGIDRPTTPPRYSATATPFSSLLPSRSRYPRVSPIINTNTITSSTKFIKIVFFLPSRGDRYRETNNELIDFVSKSKTFEKRGGPLFSRDNRIVLSLPLPPVKRKGTKTRRKYIYIRKGRKGKV